MKRVLLGLCVSAAFIVGCAVGASRYVASPAYAQPPGASRWEYTCFQEYDVEDLQAYAARLGSEFWELAGVGAHGGGGEPIWCFKRPRP